MHLANCIPELDLSIVLNTVICGKCADTINSLYIFKKECLQLEMQIREYIQQVHHTDNVIDLAAVMQFHQLYSKNLTVELKTEAFEKTENYKNEESPTSFCDNHAFIKTEGNTEIATGGFEKTENCKNEEFPTSSFCNNYAFQETEEYTEIANKEYLTTLEMIDRQCVLFNTFENFINSDTKSERDENSDTHDNSNIVQDCLLQVTENPDSFIQNLNETDIYHQCFTCGHKAESKSKLIRHLISHTDKKLYQKKSLPKSHKSLFCWYRCDLCNYSTKHKCLFSYHNRAHLTKKDYGCILNSSPILVKPSANTITFGKENHKDSKIKCGSRNKHDFKYWCKSFSKCSASKQHSNQCNITKLKMDINIIVKSFKCSICDYSSNYKHNLKTHMLTHIGEKPIKCSVCEYSCNYKKSFKSHMLTHPGAKPYKCLLCEYSVNRKSHLKSHMLTHTGEKPFKCSICQYSANRKSHLKRHMLTHTGAKPFKCSVCKFSCNHKNSLNRHMLMHTAGKPFKCSVCEFSCNHKNSFKNHMLTHTGKNLFKCSICEYIFQQKSDLKRHMLTHTGAKPFKCSVCEHSFSQKYSLKSHILTHTDEKRFKCSICERIFKHKYSLTRHMLTHTGEKSF